MNVTVDRWQTKNCTGGEYASVTARRIAANIAKLPGYSHKRDGRMRKHPAATCQTQPIWEQRVYVECRAALSDRLARGRSPGNKADNYGPVNFTKYPDTEIPATSEK